jgi:signal transduction histidine kinase/CheY-like chemotaxis protein
MSGHSESILILTATARDAALAARALENSGMSALTCDNTRDLDASLEQGVGAIVLSEEASGEEVLSSLERFWSSQAPWSDLPILFLQAPGATSESPSVKRLRSRGNLVLLERPLHQLTLISATETALRARRRQYEVRDLIAEKEADVRGRDEFLAMLGHELRNPLAAIRYAIGLLDELDDGTVTKTPREVIGRQTTHLARLVDDLLDVARVTRGKITLAKKPVDLNEVARKTLESLEVSLRETGHEFVFQPWPEDILIDGDAVRIEQIFSNLLFNAFKYTPQGGRIELRLEVHENEAFAVFVDNGIGMSAELLARVFDLFSQAQNAIDRSRGGLGIGLTLVKGLVELHGGSIHATSAGAGQGSRFEVRFPLLKAVQTPSKPVAVGNSKTDWNVLLVEDNDDAREVLRILLELSGYRVDCASDGQEGLRKLIEDRPEVALVDIGLPLMDGYEVAERARAAFGDEVFLIALTGYGQPEDRQRALEAGFNEHLTKPIEASRLRELLSRVRV